MAPNVATDAPLRVKALRVEAPNVQLDPLGLAGTATQRRWRTARRAAQWRAFLGLAMLVLILALLGAWITRPGVPELPLRVVQTTDLKPQFATLQAPQLPGSDNLVVAADGELWRVIWNEATLKTERFARTGATRVAPLATNNRVFVAGENGVLSAFDTSGKFQWRTRVGTSLSTRPALANSKNSNRTIVAVGNDAGWVSGLDATSGQRIWTKFVGGPVGGALSATETWFFVPTLPGVRSRGALVALDAHSGKVRWRVPDSPAFWAPSLVAPLVDEANNLLFWPCDDGALFCLSASDGRKIWKTFAAPLAGAPPDAAVVLRGEPLKWQNRLFVGASDGAMRCFDARDGQTLWTTPLRGAHRAAPRVVNTPRGERLLVSTNRESALLDLQSGEIESRSPLVLAAWHKVSERGLATDGSVVTWR